LVKIGFFLHGSFGIQFRFISHIVDDSLAATMVHQGKGIHAQKIVYEFKKLHVTMVHELKGLLHQLKVFNHQ
jgi:hypothetical protein